MDFYIIDVTTAYPVSRSTQAHRADGSSGANYIIQHSNSDKYIILLLIRNIQEKGK